MGLTGKNCERRAKGKRIAQRSCGKLIAFGEHRGVADKLGKNFADRAIPTLLGGPESFYRKIST